MNKSLSFTFVALLCAFSLAVAMGGGGGSSSQKNYRGFEGKITDENGKKLEGVEVLLLSVDSEAVEKANITPGSEGTKTMSSTTRANGKYRFVAVRPGFYRVRYSLTGYQTLEKLMEFKRGSKDAVLNIQLHELSTDTVPASGNQP